MVKIIVLYESSTSIVMLRSPIGLDFTEPLKSQMVLESLRLRLILKKIVVKSFLFLKPSISHC